MAADLQEPPELVLRMDGVLRGGDVDVVIGVREARNDPLMSRLPARIFWGLYRRYVVHDIPAGGVDVFGCNGFFRNTLLQLQESHSSLIAQIFWLGFRRQTVSYVRQERQHGTSAWTLQKKIKYLMDSVFAFTDLPIRLLIRIGALGAGSCRSLRTGGCGGQDRGRHHRARVRDDGDPDRVLLGAQSDEPGHRRLLCLARLREHQGPAARRDPAGGGIRAAAGRKDHHG